MTVSALREKFYTMVSLEEGEGGYILLLDGRKARSRGGKVLAVRPHGLAHRLVREWDSQTTHIDFTTMAMTCYQMAVMDMGPGQRDKWINGTLAYLGSDLVCYRSQRPAELCEMMARIWDPFLALVQDKAGIRLNTTSEIMAIEQPGDSLAKARARLGEINDEQLLCVHTITELTGSAVLAMAPCFGFLDSEALARAAAIDEIFQAEKWGDDEEAATRRAAIKGQIGEAMAYFGYFQSGYTTGR